MWGTGHWARRLLALAVLGVALAAGTLPAAARDPDALTQVVTDLRSQYHIPGLVVVVVSKDSVDQVVAQELRTDTPLALGSTSKQFTGLIVQHLIARQRLALDQRLDQLLPDAAGSAFGSVTVAQLLAHRSGMSALAGAEWELWPADTSIQGEARRLLTGTPASEPGSTYEYSNANYTLLGAVVEQVTGGSYAQALQDLVVAPLGLRHTTADRGQARLDGSAEGHYPWLGSLVASTPQPEWPLAAPSAMITSTTDDLAAVVRAHLGAPPPDGASGITPEVLAAARAPLGAASEWTQYASGLDRHAFWQLTDENAGWEDPTLPTWFEHHGTTLRTFSYLGFSPERDLGVAILGDTSFGLDQQGQWVLVDRIIHTIVETRPVQVPADPLIVAAPAIMVLLPLLQLVAFVWCLRSRRWLPAAVALVLAAVSVALAFVVVPDRADVRVFSSAFLASVPDLALSLWTSLAVAALTVGMLLVRTLGRLRRAPRRA